MICELTYTKGSDRCLFVGAVSLFASRDTNSTKDLSYASMFYSAKFECTCICMHAHTHVFIYSKFVFTIELMVMKLFIKKLFYRGRRKLHIKCLAPSKSGRICISFIYL
jgi:hypothetical protein